MCCEVALATTRWLGGYGRDVMSGGADTDIFMFTFASQTGNTAATRDVITDFHQAEHDRIDVSRIDADGNYGNGVTPFTFIGTAGFHGVAGELRVHKIDLAGTAHDVTLILGDISGTGTSQFQIALKGLVTLTEADFILA